MPTTGSSAAYPGTRVPSSKRSAAAPTMTSPSQEAPARSPPGSRPMRSSAAATAAPRPSSQARARVEKYAASGSVETSWTP